MFTHLLSILIGINLFYAPVTKKLPTYKIVGTITQTESYCGGAAPSEEMIKELNTPKPIAKLKLWIKKGKVNTPEGKIIKEIITDSLGQFFVKLPPGEYLLVNADKATRIRYFEILSKYAVKTSSQEAVNVKCLDKWFAQPDFVFTVSKTSKKNIAHNYNISCNWSGAPCVEYNGPFPP